MPPCIGTLRVQLRCSPTPPEWERRAQAWARGCGAAHRHHIGRHATSQTLRLAHSVTGPTGRRVSRPGRGSHFSPSVKLFGGGWRRGDTGGSGSLCRQDSTGNVGKRLWRSRPRSAGGTGLTQPNVAPRDAGAKGSRGRGAIVTVVAPQRVHTTGLATSIRASVQHVSSRDGKLFVFAVSAVCLPYAASVAYRDAAV